ncbi:MAG: hypothetical protein QOJ91_887 [Sphingomonadales bacterium]|jgi:hypothetical protein|nr:hypothetical protein [Sphingomonadales bacterium]
MSLIGILGILISIGGFYFARANESRARLILFVLMLLAHVGASIVYFFYAQEFGGDASLYYYDQFGIYGTDTTGLSTIFIINFVQFLKEYFGGSFFDYFLLFQAMGFWGLLFVLRSFDDIHEELAQPQNRYVYLLLFLPGLNFWTSAIGKDAPIALAVAMCTWAVFRLQSRYLAFAAGVVISLLVRPHIALITLVALAATVLVARKTSLLSRVALLVVALAGIASVWGLVEQSFNGLNISNTDSVSEFIETKSSVSEESGGDISIINASFPVRLVSLLFRPFFIDASGALGYVASLENVVLLFIIGSLVWRFRTVVSVARAALFARFAILFFMLLVMLLAMVNYNVGLGLRQKMMTMPALLVFFAALVTVRGARKSLLYDSGGSVYAGASPAPQSFRRA